MEMTRLLIQSMSAEQDRDWVSAASIAHLIWFHIHSRRIHRGEASDTPFHRRAITTLHHGLAFDSTIWIHPCRTNPFADKLLRLWAGIMRLATLSATLNQPRSLR
jgi:hypothetical protein